MIVLIPNRMLCFRFEHGFATLLSSNKHETDQLTTFYENKREKIVFMKAKRRENNERNEKIKRNKKIKSKKRDTSSSSYKALCMRRAMYIGFAIILIISNRKKRCENVAKPRENVLFFLVVRFVHILLICFIFLLLFGFVRTLRLVALCNRL